MRFFVMEGTNQRLLRTRENWGLIGEEKVDRPEELILRPWPFPIVIWSGPSKGVTCWMWHIGHMVRSIKIKIPTLRRCDNRTSQKNLRRVGWLFWSLNSLWWRLNVSILGLSNILNRFRILRGWNHILNRLCILNLLWGKSRRSPLNSGRGWRKTWHIVLIKTMITEWCTMSSLVTFGIKHRRNDLCRHHCVLDCNHHSHDGQSFNHHDHRKIDFRWNCHQKKSEKSNWPVPEN